MTLDPELKLPPITRNTKMLSFDVESNGLHGPAFAVAAVVMNSAGEILDEFKGRCPIEGEVDPWVAENVLPVMKDFTENYADARAMRDGFWQWWVKAKPTADIVLVSNGYPVEMRFLITCQEDDIETRYWEHPFPLVELNSLLLAVGVNSRHRLVEDKLKDKGEIKHNPYWDAWVSVLSGFAALQLAGRLKD